MEPNSSNHIDGSVSRRLECHRFALRPCSIASNRCVLPDPLTLVITAKSGKSVSGKCDIERCGFWICRWIMGLIDRKPSLLVSAGSLAHYFEAIARIRASYSETYLKLFS